MQRLADLRANAEGRLKRVQELRRIYQEKWQTLLRTLEERFEIARELKSVQDEIAGIRARHNERLETTLNRFLPEWMQVSIELRPGGDTGEYADWLYKVFGARSHQVKRVRQILEENVAPTALAEMIWKQEFGDLATLSESLPMDMAVNEQDREACAQRTKVVEQDEGAAVNVLVEDGAQLTSLMDLQETQWDDREAILLNEVPVDQKSPGQRSSAMLPLIALAENTPLVIDQPEDNLDKRLVGTVLSSVLAELKEQRQIIVCTHDPNILVGGDAEQIIVLGAESERKGQVEKHGSIDNDDIIGTVVDLLEGGEDAFARRRKRYKGRV